MAGGNFHDNLKIDHDGHLLPSGPLTQVAGETGTEVYVWVMQAHGSGAGAFVQCEAVPSPDGSAWITDKSTVENKGQFVPGPAVGQGMATAMLNGATTVFWWSESLELTS